MNKKVKYRTRENTRKEETKMSEESKKDALDMKQLDAVSGGQPGIILDPQETCFHGDYILLNMRKEINGKMYECVECGRCKLQMWVLQSSLFSSATASYDFAPAKSK